MRGPLSKELRQSLGLLIGSALALGLYLGLAWFAVASSIVLLTVGLWNAGLAASEKGFYAMSFVLSLFAAVAVQKNVRDLDRVHRDEEDVPAHGMFG